VIDAKHSDEEPRVPAGANPVGALSMVPLVPHAAAIARLKIRATCTGERRPARAAAGAGAASSARNTPASCGAPPRKVLGWPNRCKLAHAFLWEYSYKRLKLVQLLGQLGFFLTALA
jgi:hypothetical protein